MIARTAAHHPELHCLYMDLLSDVLAPYALDLALSLLALEDSLELNDDQP